MAFTIKRVCQTNLRLTEFSCEIPTSPTIQELTFSRPRVNMVDVPSPTMSGEMETVYEVVFEVAVEGARPGGYNGIFGVTVRGVSDDDYSVIIKTAETIIKDMGQ